MSFRQLIVLTCALFAAAAAKEEAEDTIAQMFVEMDTDKDGSLSFDEYTGLAGEEDLGMSSEDLEEMKKEMRHSFTVLDEDNNGKLSQTELAKELEDPLASEENEMSAMEEGAEEQDMEQRMEDAEEDDVMDEQQMDEQQWAQEMMEELDKDKDGQLSFAEFEGEEIDVIGEADKDEMHKDFRKADKNNDGQLSVEELKHFNMGDEQLNDEA